VRVEHELKVGAVPDQVWALARGPAALSAMPGRFAFGVPAEVTGTDRLCCLITANRAVTCAMVDVAQEIDGQMICWQARRRYPTPNRRWIRRRWHTQAACRGRRSG
jgi:hypothetical protein